MTSPDTGTTDTIYNALGKPTQITDGRGVVTNLTYDNAGRLLTKQYPAATAENITFTWDATAGGNKGVGGTTYHYRHNNRGRLDRLTIGSTVTADYAYDGLERLALRTTTSPAATTHYVYGLAGRLIAEVIAAGTTVSQYIWLDDMPLIPRRESIRNANGAPRCGGNTMQALVRLRSVSSASPAFY